MSGQPVDHSESIFVENRQREFPVDTGSIEKAIAFVLGEEGIADGEVTVTFVDSAEMAGLNMRFRGIDSPTDVLSFCMTEKIDSEPDVVFADSEHILGDIVVCPDAAADNALDLGHPLEAEILEITIHGLLHLLGHSHDTADDERRMLTRQEELAAKLR